MFPISYSPLWKIYIYMQWFFQYSVLESRVYLQPLHREHLHHREHLSCGNTTNPYPKIRCIPKIGLHKQATLNNENTHNCDSRRIVFPHQSKMCLSQRCLTWRVASRHYWFWNHLITFWSKFHPIHLLLRRIDTPENSKIYPNRKNWHSTEIFFSMKHNPYSSMTS